ncbi:MAG TPA: hypothetical protein VE197_11540 [Mycobacterium sp.]|nr:hypothetical protein [Mycobacterium sp.]
MADWLADFDAVPENYVLVSGFGNVHAGFLEVYATVRNSIAVNLANAIAECDQILVTGHSLGAALAVLAAPDILRNMPPNKIEPRLITFAGPRVGLTDFAAAFDAAIESCFRVVNFLDIVPPGTAGALCARRHRNSGRQWWARRHWMAPQSSRLPGRAVRIDSGPGVTWLNQM